MRFNGKSLFALVLVVALPYTYCSREKTSATPQTDLKYLPSNLQNPHTRSFVEAYEDYFRDAMKQSRTPGAAVVIVKDTSIIYMRGFGVKKSRTRDSIDANTVFRIGSLSKGFCGVLSGMLVAEGKFSYQDKVKGHLPNFQLWTKDHTENATLEHLLSHTTGLPYHTYSNLIEDGWQLKNMAAQLRRVRPASPLGKVYNYQNVIFSLMEEVMRNTTNESYQHLLREKIFRPLGMKNASLTYSEIISNKNKSYPHDNLGGKMMITPRYYNTAAAGGVNASIADMAQWLQLLLGNRSQIVADTTLDEVFRPIVSTSNERRVFGAWNAAQGAYYAKGWRVVDCNPDMIIYHGGYVNGFRSEIAFNRKEKLGICVLFNAPTPVANSCVPKFFDFYKYFEPDIEHWDKKGKYREAISLKEEVSSFSGQP
jgi:beta-lactamase class C